jgi:hypothetical protein
MWSQQHGSVTASFGTVNVPSGAGACQAVWVCVAAQSANCQVPERRKWALTLNSTSLKTGQPRIITQAGPCKLPSCSVLWAGKEVQSVMFQLTCMQAKRS